MKTVLAVHLFNTLSVAGGRPIADITVGPQGDVLLLTQQPALEHRVLHRSGAGAGRDFGPLPHLFCIHRLPVENNEPVPLPSTFEQYNFVEPLGDEEWLLVRARTINKADHNAHVFNSHGEELHSFHAGDGIRDVQTSRDGAIWISYFDEGVYGSGDLGAPGLVRFNREGHPVWQFDQVDDWSRDVPPIDDCYALNIAGDDNAWLYYHTGFTLAHIRAGQLAGLWKSFPVAGASAFAVGDNYALFAGAYKQRDKLFLVNLLNLTLQDIHPVDRQGQPLEFRSALGRDGHLYLVTEADVYVVDVNDI